jgi:hypothetical protein
MSEVISEQVTTAATAEQEPKTEFKCHICEAFVGHDFEDYPWGGEVQTCQACFEKFGPVLAHALSMSHGEEASGKFDGHYVAVLKGGREIHFDAAQIIGAEWIVPCNVKGVYRHRELEGGRNYYNLSFRLSELSYICDLYEPERTADDERDIIREGLKRLTPPNPNKK